MNGMVIILRMTTRQTMWNALTIPWWFVALLRSSKHAKCYSYHAQTIFRQLFRQDFPMTFPWLLIKSLTFHWKLSNSLTFPGFPDKWSPLIFVLALIMKIALYSIITFWALWISTLLSWKILFFCGKWRATTASPLATDCHLVHECTSDYLYYLQQSQSKVATQLNVMHPQVITSSRFLGNGEVQAGSHSSPALHHMCTLLSSAILT